MRRQIDHGNDDQFYDVRGPHLFDQFDDLDDGFDLLDGDAPDQLADPETSEFWGAVPAGRLERLRDARYRSRTRRRTTPSAPGLPTASEVVQRVQDATTHVDPLLKRAGTMMAVIALFVPVALALRGGDEPAAIAAAGPAATVAADAAATTIKWYEPLPTRPPTSVTTPSRKKSPPATMPTTPTTPPRPVTATTTATKSVAVAAVVECTKKYTVVSGDSWILIARKVSVTLDEMLSANNATTRTMLWPRQQICLPPNASPPTTSKPTPTTAKPTPTTARPTPTTSRPVTTVPRITYSRAQVEQIIREVWPDDLEAKALTIAVRESNLNPYSQNSCCSGLFQIYFNVHRGWLAGIGVTSANQLLDPRVNASAALKLYQRNGWGPWE